MTPSVTLAIFQESFGSTHRDQTIVPALDREDFVLQHRVVGFECPVFRFARVGQDVGRDLGKGLSVAGSDS